MSKVMSVEQAIQRIHDGDSVMIGGFGGHGSPHTIIEALVNKNTKDLTLICNDTGKQNFGAGRLIATKQIKKVRASIIGPNPESVQQLADGIIEVELIPQGSLAEMIRSGGYGLGGIITKTGLGTLVAEGKQQITIKGETYLVEEAIQADVALIYASKADKAGNAVFHGSSRAHSPSMAAAARYTILEVGKLVEVGEISPDDIHVQSVLVDAIVVTGGK